MRSGNFNLPLAVSHGFCLTLLVTALSTAVNFAGVAQGEEPAKVETLMPGAKLVRLEAIPEKIELQHPYDYSQVLVTAVMDSGDRVDATRLVEKQLAKELAVITPQGIVRPAANGNGELKLSLAGQSISVPVVVSGQKQAYPVSFVSDVQPVLSKLGCNQGTCHGSAQGKNGFKLSLRGYDPLFDHRALTDDLAGRRFNRAAPDQSLMLLKPSGSVPHAGGGLTKPGEPYYEMLREWIASGVKLDLDSPRVAKIEILPKNPQVPLVEMKQQMKVIATYTDGKVRDVSAEAFLESGLADVVTVNKQGLATAERRGEAAILARFEGAYAATTLVVMGDRKDYQWKPVPENNYIDTLVYNKLKKVKILPSELCNDAEFIRRVYLDLIGLPPEPEQVRAFLADPRDTKVKREALIDQLVGSPDFIDQWTNKWADLLQVNRKFLGEEGAWAFRNWIRQAVSTNMPYDKFVYSVLTGSGSTLANPPASYYKVLRQPGDVMENTTQLFLAVRFNCNKCHDHPFERWTQDQYYHLSAYFAQIGRKAAPEFADKKIGGSAVEQALPLVEVVFDQGTGEVTHERTGQVTAPEFPYQKDLAPASQSRREQLARWITSRDNQYFAKSYVNRIWSYLLGTGIIEPIDDIRAGNPATNPELLDRLTKEFIDSNFDVRKLFITICKSRTYQHSLVTNPFNQDDEINYSHAIARRLPAETMFDAIHRVTGSVSHLPEVPSGFRASQMADSTAKLSDGFFDLFGRPARESACECERSTGVMLGQALNLINGPTIANAVADPQNRIAKLIATEKDDAKIVDELFLAILSRLPTPEERNATLPEFQAVRQEQAARIAALAAYEKDQLPKLQTAWEQTAKGAVWQPLDIASMISAGGGTMTKQADGSILLGGTASTTDVYTLVANTTLTGITGFRLDVLADPSLPAQGPGRSEKGNFVLNEVSVRQAPLGNPAQPQSLTLQNATADFSQEAYAAAGAIDGNPKTGWAIVPKLGVPHTLLMETKDNAGIAGGATLTFTLDQSFGMQHTIGKLRISATTAPRPLKLDDALPAPVTAVLAVASEKRTPEQVAELSKHFRSIDAGWQKLSAAVTEGAKQQDQSRLLGAQDIAWALINSPAFLFNR
jgi:hypothetical protein